MIVDMEKYLIFGVKDDIDRFFAYAQKEGFIEFISPIQQKAFDPPQEVKELVSALKILRKQPPLGWGDEPKSNVSLEDAAKNILSLQSSIDKLQERERLLRSEIARIAPFGDFSMEDLRWIEKEGKKVFQFFCKKTTQGKEKGQEGEIPVFMIYLGTDYDLDYYVVIHREIEKYPGMIEVKIDEPVGALKKQLSEIAWEIKNKEKELRLLAEFFTPLQRILVHRLNRHHLQSAKKNISTIEELLFSVEAWVPKTHVEAFQKLVEKFSIEAFAIEIEKEDRVPTCMENKGAARVGEDLVSIYDIPSPKDKDPSLWVFWAFSIFYAIIISDAGYGLLYLLLAFCMRGEKIEKRPSLRRIRRLVGILGVNCIIWGALTGAFFGNSVNPDHRLYPYAVINRIAEKKAEYHIAKKDLVYQDWQKQYPSALQEKSAKKFLEKAFKFEESVKTYEPLDSLRNDILMEFSLLVGMIHIILSLLRYGKRNWAAFGWVLAILGGYLYFPFIIGANSFVIYLGILSAPIAEFLGMNLLYFGIIFALLIAVIQKKWTGMLELMTAIQIFADILSYLRLYALGFAGMIMAMTFNSMAGSLPAAIGFFVIIIGHMINFSLGIMSGVIHGLRLNFIEWYHYSFEGDGKIFRPLKLFK